VRKCRETPWKLLFVCASFGGVIFKISIFASRRPNHVKHLLSGLYNVLKCKLHSLRSPTGDPRIAHCSHFSVRISPLISCFSTLTGFSARGPQGRIDTTALRPDSNLFLAAPLVVRCMYIVVVPGPMPAAVASRCCQRRFQQLACACGS
jgi:hypothetical protein